MMLSGAFVGVRLLSHSLVLVLGGSAVLTAFCSLTQVFREETPLEEKLHDANR
jgi:hypothetical protein